MDRAGIEAAAALLANARRQGMRIGPLPEHCRPQTVAEAHAIQDALGGLLGLDVGAYKASIPAARNTEPGRSALPVALETGVRAPIFMSSVYASPAAVPVKEVPQCGVEGEIAFRFLRDLPPRDVPYTREEIVAAIEACAALEVVTSRFAEPEQATFLDKLADCVSNGGFVHGPGVPNWRELPSLENLRVTLTVNGKPVVEQSGGHPTGNLLGIVAALVEMQRTAGGILAGQFVTCGSFTGLRYLQPGDACGVTFDGLGSAELTFVP